MSLICPQCSQVNEDSTTFCRSCGYRLQENGQGAGEEATMRPASLAGVPSEADPAATLRPGLPPVSQPTPPQTPQASTPYEQPPALPPQTPQVAPAYGQPPPAANPAQSQSPFFSQPLPPAQGGYPQQQQPVYGQYPGYGAGAPMMVPQRAAVPVMATLQRAFAGKGVPVHHQSWLLEGKQAQPQALNNALIANLQKQGVMGVIIEPERLREQGVVMEERDYIKVRYGTSTVFTYLAPMGQNLYVSRTSTIQQPYSRIRAIVLLALLLLMLISLLLYAVVNPAFDPATGFSSTYGFVSAVKTFFGYAFYGLFFFFIIAALRAFVFWLTDKDFLAILRPNRLSDFSLDALASIELTTDKALRTTLQEAGLDAEAISLAQVSAPAQALHRF